MSTRTGDDSLGAVVVGTSIGALLHVPALREAGFVVRGLVGRDQARTSARSALLGVPSAFTSLAEALARPDVDVVAVATPPHTHAPLVYEILAVARHVLCEKPFARDKSEAAELLAAADDAGVVHALGTEFRFDGPQALLNRIVRAGAIGVPRFVVEFLQVPTLASPGARVPAWFDQAETGGGWFGGSAPHILDRVRSILGEFATVNASLCRLGPCEGVTADDTYTITFTLESGVEGVIYSSAAVAGPPTVATRVTGTAGTAWVDIASRTVFVDDGAGPRQILLPDDLRDRPPVPPSPELLTTSYEMWHSTGMEVIPYARLYRVMRDRITGAASPPDPVLPTFEDGLRLEIVMDAIRRSSAARQTVTVD